MSKQNNKGGATAPQGKSKYAGVSAARAQRPANYFKPGGHFLVRLSKIEEGEDRFKTALVAAVGNVIHAFPDNAPTSNKVGEEVSEVIKRSNVAYEGRLKALAMAVGDLTETDFEEQAYDGEIFDEMVGEDQPAAGVVVEVRTVHVLKQAAATKAADKLEAKDFYTRVDFLRRLLFAEVKETLSMAGLDERTINARVPDIDAEIEQESKSEDDPRNEQ